jgi:hypothetical protein
MCVCVWKKTQSMPALRRQGVVVCANKGHLMAKVQEVCANKGHLMAKVQEVCANKGYDVSRVGYTPEHFRTLARRLV